MVKNLCLFLALGLSSGAFSQNNVKEKFSSYLDSLNVHHKVMGSFAFAHDDQPAFVKVTGFADAEKQQKANMNTQYRIGSVSKTFTAVLVMKAVEDKKLSLNTKLSDFFPEIINADKITIENLLQHRSGIHNITGEPEFLNIYTKPQTGEQLLSFIKKYPSDFSPGSKYSYSNSNYIILGLMLEKIYKQPYAELIGNKIAKPLQLSYTEVGGKISASENQAKSYRYLGIYQALPETDMSIPIGAGNIISTPTEMLKFIIGLENGKLIAKNSLTKMKTFVDNYGFGLVKADINTYSGFGHEGAIDGFQSALYYFPESKIAVSFITNQSSYDNHDILIKMMQAAAGKDFEMPSFKGISVSENILKKYEGTYKAPNFPLDIKIFVENGILKGQATGQGAFPLKAMSETKFEFDLAGITIEFDADKNSMNFSQGANNIIFKKQ